VYSPPDDECIHSKLVDELKLYKVIYIYIYTGLFFLEKRLPELLNIIDSSCCEGGFVLIKSNSIS
jgi:hypothetical protein